MIRIILREDNWGPQIHTQSALITKLKTIDVDLPEAEKFLAAEVDKYIQRTFVGIEILHDPKLGKE